MEKIIELLNAKGINCEVNDEKLVCSMNGLSMAFDKPNEDVDASRYANVIIESFTIQGKLRDDDYDVIEVE